MNFQDKVSAVTTKEERAKLVQTVLAPKKEDDDFLRKISKRITDAFSNKK